MFPFGALKFVCTVVDKHGPKQQIKRISHFAWPLWLHDSMFQDYMTLLWDRKITNFIIITLLPILIRFPQWMRACGFFLQTNPLSGVLVLLIPSFQTMMYWQIPLGVTTTTIRPIHNEMRLYMASISTDRPTGLFSWYNTIESEKRENWTRFFF